MKFENIKVGDTIVFDINGTEVKCTYVGRFDFLYLFNTQFKTLPKVTRVQNHSIAIVNQELLSQYGITNEEVKAILYHEVGHMISLDQARLSGIDAEYDAVNGSMYFDGLEEVKKYTNEIICFYSNNDPYVKFEAEKDFADKLGAKQVLLNNAGHINSESGYDTFEEIVSYL